MGKIQVIALEVEGDTEAITQALKVAASYFQGFQTQPALEHSAAVEQRPATAPKPEPIGKESYPCHHCDEVFERKGQRSVHTRYKHPLNRETAVEGKLHCPRNGCDRTFTKQAWLKVHLERDHGAAL